MDDRDEALERLAAMLGGLADEGEGMTVGEMDVIEAVEVIHTLYEAANGTSKLTQEGLDLLDSMAPTLIGGMVRDLNVRKPSRGVSADERLVPGLGSAIGGKAVREAPCGCGSGRPYHRCCGAH